KNVMPVHGESKHLHANAELARRTGVPEKNIVLARDGDTVDLVDGQAKITGTVEAGLVYVDGQTIGTATEDTLAERRMLSGGGVGEEIIVEAVGSYLRRTYRREPAVMAVVVDA